MPETQDTTIDGRELLAIRARTARARDGQHQSLRQTEADREALLAETYRLRNRVAALKANGAELLARAEHAEDAAQLHGERADRWRRERDAARRERDDYQDRLRKAEGAYTRLDAEKRNLEGVRDRWKARAEEAERELSEARNATQGLEMYLEGVESQCSANRLNVPSWVGSVRAAMGITPDGGE